MRLHIRNFQAVAEADLQAEGLTVITGKTNLGKSALIRATAATLFGLPGEHFVRRGEDWTSGSVDFEDPANPLKVTWRKVPAHKRKPNLQPTLEINGQEHTKTGRDHKLLTAPHGVTELETTATRLRPQVATQHDPIFLVGENETTCAEVFKLLGRTDQVTAAQAAVRTDLRGAEQLRRTRTEDLGRAEAALLELASTPQLNQELETLRARHSDAEQAAARSQRLRAALLELRTRAPTPTPKPPTEPDLGQLETSKAALRELTRFAPRRLPTAPKPPKQPEQEAATQLRELATTEAQLALARTQRAQLQAEQEDADTETEELRKLLKTCPTCGQPIHGGHDGERA